jgi:hypothetical protein
MKRFYAAAIVAVVACALALSGYIFLSSQIQPDREACKVALIESIRASMALTPAGVVNPSEKPKSCNGLDDSELASVATEAMDTCGTLVLILRSTP